MRRLLAIILFPLVLAGCTAEPIWAPEEQVQAAVYRNSEPASLTLFTMVNNRSGEGAHTGLMINGSQRVMFDPAGTWGHHTVPERNDVHYGITPRILRFYQDYHARETFRIVQHTIEVEPEVAEMAIRAVQEYGAVPKASCTRATSSILRTLPGFESLPARLFPGKFMRDFAALPGVTEMVIRQDADPDDNSAVLAQQQAR